MQGERERESQRPMQWMSHSAPQPSLPSHSYPLLSFHWLNGTSHTHKHILGCIHVGLWEGHTQTNTNTAHDGFLPILSVVAKPVNMSSLWITTNGSYSYACMHTYTHTCTDAQILYCTLSAHIHAHVQANESTMNMCTQSHTCTLICWLFFFKYTHTHTHLPLSHSALNNHCWGVWGKHLTSWLLIEGLVELCTPRCECVKLNNQKYDSS